MMTPIKTATAFAAAGLALITTSAFAESVSVSYRDLDLSTAEGREMLETRLDRAAKEVCGIDEVRTGTRIRSRSAGECYENAKTQLSERVAMLVAKEKKGG